MIKSIISTLAAVIIFISGGIAEKIYVEKAFSSFDKKLEILYDKSIDKTINTSDVLGVQKFWIEQKHKLHVIIPHTEIKEIDLWLSEAVRLTGQNNYDEAMQKFEVLRELCEQIPSTYKLRLENIF